MPIAAKVGDKPATISSYLFIGAHEEFKGILHQFVFMQSIRMLILLCYYIPNYSNCVFLDLFIFGVEGRNYALHRTLVFDYRLD
jgi:hypothetical protein